MFFGFSESLSPSDFVLSATKQLSANSYLHDAKIRLHSSNALFDLRHKYQVNSFFPHRLTALPQGEDSITLVKILPLGRNPKGEGELFLVPESSVDTCVLTYYWFSGLNLRTAAPAFHISDSRSSFNSASNLGR